MTGTSIATEQSVRAVTFEVNGRTYRPAARSIVVICLDGCADEYLTVSIGAGLMPRLAQATQRGYRGLVRAALPTFTNVNNASIVTGAPPSVTGISGNFFLDPQSGEEVMMNSADYLRCPTILAAAAEAGRRVAMVTAKQKLLDILSHGLTGIAFSAERADHADLSAYGVTNVTGLINEPVPNIYSGDASVFVLKAGAALLQHGTADLLYLSLTDYIQHKHAPESPESLAFYAALDEPIGQMIDSGAVVALTADHGMNAKQHPDGSPYVIYLQSLLDERLGPDRARVVCPITDPYVVHHGALGSLVMVHLDDATELPRLSQWIMSLDGVSDIYDRATAAHKLQLPADRIGDLVVLAGRNAAIGKTPADHDLSLLNGRLRTHGGRYEEMVPLVISEPLNGDYARLAASDPRNFDVFDFVCNGLNK